MQQAKVIKIQDHVGPKERALLYAEIILDLIDELPADNEKAQEVHRTLMMYPEFWEL